MSSGFVAKFVGKKDIESSIGRCVACNRLTLLSSYTTRRFIYLSSLSLIPARKYFILDECPHCGFQGKANAWRYKRDKKKNLALMMDGFKSSPDDPDVCCHALQTLSVYNESAWFMDVTKSYGLRFETNAEVQHLIAKGLCRFGEYDKAALYCRKALVLGAGGQVDELLSLCMKLQEATGSGSGFEGLRTLPESAGKAYIPLMSVAASLFLLVVGLGVSAMHTHKAWLVNGSLSAYSFTLDGEPYSLEAGSAKKVKLKLGRHRLEMDSEPYFDFNYTVHFLEQMLRKQMLVINPDEMALISVLQKGKNGVAEVHAHSSKVHALTSVGQTLFITKDDSAVKSGGINFFRPDTHMAEISRLMKLGYDKASRSYARKALRMDPSTAEAGLLFPVALQGAGMDQKSKFLSESLSQSPALLSWHLYYQDEALFSNRAQQLKEEYVQWCKDHPDDPAGFYLLGRVLPNPADAERFYMRSEKNGGMKGRGYSAIAGDLYIRGEYKEALPYADKAIAADSDNPAFHQLREQILVTLRKYDDLVKSVKSDSLESVEKTILYLTCAGYHQEAESMAEEFSNGIPELFSRLNAIRFYAVGNIPAYLDCLIGAGEPAAEFRRLIHENKLVASDAELSKGENYIWKEHLVLYCAARHGGEEDIAERHLAAAVAKVGNDALPLVQVKALLASAQPPAESRIMKLNADLADKALLCAVLGYRFPEHQREFFQLSDKFNVYPVYPQLLIRKWLRPKPGQASARLKPAA